MKNVVDCFQYFYASKRFLGKKIECNPKPGLLFLTGGGNGEPDHAIYLAKKIFKYLNATYTYGNFISSLNTDETAAKDDEIALGKAREAALRLISR